MDVQQALEQRRKQRENAVNVALQRRRVQMQKTAASKATEINDRLNAVISRQNEMASIYGYQGAGRYGEMAEADREQMYADTEEIGALTNEINKYSAYLDPEGLAQIREAVSDLSNSFRGLRSVAQSYSQYESADAYNAAQEQIAYRQQVDGMSSDELMVHTNKLVDDKKRDANKYEYAAYYVDSLLDGNSEEWIVQNFPEYKTAYDEFVSTHNIDTELNTPAAIRQMIYDEYIKTPEPTWEKNPTLYYDDDGLAMTANTLITLKKMDETLKAIGEDPAANGYYADYQAYREEQDKIGQAISFAGNVFNSTPADPYEGTEGEKSNWKYIVDKYGATYGFTEGDINKSWMDDKLLQIQQVEGQKLYDAEKTSSEKLKELGYSTEEIETYKRWMQDRERRQKQQQASAEFASKYPGLATIGSIALAPLQIVEYADNIVQGIKGKAAGSYSAAGLPNTVDDVVSNMGDTLTSTVAQDISTAVQKAGGAEWLAKGASAIYSGVVSASESAGIALGCKALFGPAGEAVALGIMASQAAASQYRSAVNNGASFEQATVSSVAAGAAEAFFEKFSMDNLIKLKDAGFDASTLRAGIKSAFQKTGNVMVQGLTEASEELGTEFANRLTDDLINGDHSAYYTAVDKYVREGLTQEEAKKKASEDWYAQILESLVGGFAGGVASGGLVSTVQSVSSIADQRSLNKELAQAIAGDENAFNDLLKVAEDVAEKATGSAKESLNRLIGNAKANKTGKNLRALMDRVNAVKQQLRIAEDKAGIKDARKTGDRDKVAEAKAKLRSTRENGHHYAEGAVLLAATGREAKAARVRQNQKYAAADQMVDTNAETGNRITIISAETVDRDGKSQLVFHLNDGTTIAAADVHYATGNRALIVQAIEETGMDGEAAMALLNAADQMPDGALTAVALTEAFQSGERYINKEHAREDLVGAALTEEMFDVAYEAGRRFADQGKRLSRTLTNTSNDGTVQSDDVKNMARNSKYMEYFPSSHKNGDVHYWCTMWAKSDMVQSGDCSVVEYNGKYYEIQKHDDADFGYRIISQLTKEQYKRRKDKGVYEYELSAEIKDGRNISDGHGVSDQEHETIRERSFDNQSSMRYGSADEGVHRLGDSSHSGDGKNSLRRDRSDVRSQRRAQGSADPNAEGGQTGVKNSTRNSMRRKDIRDDIYYPRNKRNASAFLRSFADQTMHLKDGEIENVLVYTANDVYLVSATGYLSGNIDQVFSLDNDDMAVIRKVTKEFRDGTDESAKTPDTWSKALRHDRRTNDWDNGSNENAQAEGRPDDVDGGALGGDTLGYNWESYGYSSYDEFVEAIRAGAKILDDNGNLIEYSNSNPLSGQAKYSRRNTMSPKVKDGQTVKTTESQKADGEPNRPSVRFAVTANGSQSQKTTPTPRFGEVGGSFYDGTGKNLSTGKIKGVWATQIDLLKKLSRLLGLNIEVYESHDGSFTDRRGRVHEDINGAFMREGDVIMIDLKAGKDYSGLMTNTLAHELVHRIRVWSPAKFYALADYLMESFPEVDANAMKFIRDRMQSEPGLSFDDAYEEVVADAMEGMLNGEDVMNHMAAITRKDQELGHRLIREAKQAVKRMLSVFQRDEFNYDPQTNAGAAVMRMTDRLDEIRRLFAEGLADMTEQAARRADAVSENKKSANDAADGVFENSQPMKNMLRSGFETDMDDFNLRRTSFGRQLADWRSNQGAAGGSYNGHYFELGKTPRSLIKHGAPDVSLIMYDDCLVKITGGKHDTALEEIAKIPQELSDPILLFKGSVPNSFVAVTEIQTKQGHEAIVAVHINKRHGRNVINKIASLYSKTSEKFERDNLGNYVLNQIKEGNLIDASTKKASTWFTTRGLQLPKVVQTIIDANNSISTSSEKINPLAEKNSRRQRSNRDILTEALETVANEGERTQINQYLSLMYQTDRLQEKVDALNARLVKLDKTQGKAEIARLHEQLDSLNEQIGKNDRLIAKLGGQKAISRLIARDRKQTEAAYNEKWKARNEAISREGELKKIKADLADLNKWLLRPTKEKHVPVDLQRPIAEALNALNLDASAGRDLAAQAWLKNIRDGYAKIINDTDEVIRRGYDEVIAEDVQNLIDDVGDTSLHDMTLEQRRKVYDVIHKMRNRVMSANRLHNRQRAASVAQAQQDIVNENNAHKGIAKQSKLMDFLRSSMYGMEKPIYFFRMLGSETLQGLFQDLLDAQYVWAIDNNDAKVFKENLDEQYGVKGWNMDEVFHFRDADGKAMDLTRAEILSLYCYGKRNAGERHLFEKGICKDKTKPKAGQPKIIPEFLQERNTDEEHRLTKELWTQIVGLDESSQGGALTAQMREYADKMQAYLVEVMGELGNQVSRALYGVNLFKDPNYFPLAIKVTGDQITQVTIAPRVATPGYAKHLDPNATGAVVLNGFEDVWGSYVISMSMYHAFALPIDDFTRVMDSRLAEDGKTKIQSGNIVRKSIEETWGEQAVDYIARLIRDINNGIQNGQSGFAEKSLSRFKKTSTMASLSVMIQQLSSLPRAFAVIDPKYFLDIKAMKDTVLLNMHSELWEEVKRYAPVAIIKEMGRFDTGVSAGTLDWIKGSKSGFSMKKLDDFLSKAPGFMDELVWVQIWNATKAEVADKTGLTGEALLEAAGDRFTEIIELTQVYDSVLTRSGLMREQNGFVKAATTFASEPTVIVNMMIDAVIGMKRNGAAGAAHAVRVFSCLLVSTLYNVLLKALPYAARDDDEDKTFAEKYVKSVVGGLRDDLNPLNLIPYVRDIVSVVQGYDIERVEMQLVANAVKAAMRLFNKENATVEDWLNLATAIGDCLGIPASNILREIKAGINIGKMVGSKRKATGTGLLIAAKEGWSGEEINNANQLYQAYISGDPVAIRQARSVYKTPESADSALLGALRENDKRIVQAGQYRFEGNMLKQGKLINEIVAEGYFTQGQVMKAVLAEAEVCKKKQEPEQEPYDGTYEEVKDATDPMSYTNADLKYAMERGENTEEIVESMVEDRIKPGTSRKQATAAIRDSVIGTYREKYLDAYESGDQAEMERIRQMLIDSGLWKGSSAVKNVLSNWIKNKEE